jgi:ABC-type dipeptide/oligopeptide/nickel transport system permease component
MMIRAVFVLLITWIFSRTAVFLLPGDPAAYLMHESMIPVDEVTMTKLLDLDQAWYERIFTLPHTLSMIHDVPVGTLLWPAVKNSFILTLMTLLIGGTLTCIALFFTFQKPHYRPMLHRMTALITSTPLMILGPLFLLLFSVQIPLFPLHHHVQLPALLLGLYYFGFWYRSIDLQIKRFLPESSVLGARARGFNEWNVFLRSVLLPIFGKIAAYFGTQLGAILSGSVLVEVIFQWPGLGYLAYQAVIERDFPVIEATLLVGSMASILSQQLGYWAQHQFGRST